MTHRDFLEEIADEVESCYPSGGGEGSGVHAEGGGSDHHG